MDPAHRRVADIGLRTAERFGFALAGGYAVQAHGVIDRPSEDVDLFTAWERRDEFSEAVSAIVAAYRAHGYAVEIVQQFETFARLSLVDADSPSDALKVDLAANWRLMPPIVMEIGPVLHPDDVAAGKMSALYTRAEPRDFLDVDGLLRSGRYDRPRLTELAATTDAGFSVDVLAEVFAFLDRYPDRRFTAYGASIEEITALRARFADWRASIEADPGTAEPQA